MHQVLEGLRTRHGWAVNRNEVQWIWRQWRWLIGLPAHVGFVAVDQAGWVRLEHEAALVQALQPAVGDRLPPVTVHDPQIRLHLRQRVPGLVGHDVERLVFGLPALPPSQDRYLDGCPLTPAGARFAEDLGRTLAQVHASVPVSQARGLGLAARTAATTLDAAGRVLVDHVQAPTLRNAFEHLRRWWAQRTYDSVPVHGDPHLFNVVVDPGNGSLRALLDLDEAHLGAREEDLRYLCSNGVPFARRALAAYRETAGVDVDETEVWRFHVRAAVEHLAWVPVHAPRFPHIVAWAQAAIDALAPRWRRPLPH